MSQKRGDDMFEGLGLPGIEFILPDISGPCLTEEFVVHPDVSDQIELESFQFLTEEFVVHPDVSVLDESCLSEVTRNPSIPLVESVEAFALVLIDNPFGHSSVKPSEDSPLIEQESHDLKPSVHPSVRSDVDFPLTKQECHDLKPFGVDNAECHSVSPDLAHNQATQGDEIASTADSQVSSDNPQLALVNEQSPVAGDQQMTDSSAK